MKWSSCEEFTPYNRVFESVGSYKLLSHSLPTSLMVVHEKNPEYTSEAWKHEKLCVLFLVQLATPNGKTRYQYVH